MNVSKENKGNTVGELNKTVQISSEKNNRFSVKKPLWSDKARAFVDDLIEKIKGSKFIRGLLTGTLPLQYFNEYVNQDIIYCEEYEISLGILSERLKYYNKEYSEIFLRHSNSTKKYPKYFDDEYIIPFGLKKSSLRNDTCDKYIQFERENVVAGTLPDALCACLACFWVYKEIGRYMYENKPEKNKEIYSKFIDDNSGHKIEKLEKYLCIVNEIAEKYPEMNEHMLDVYRKAVQFEYEFWESCCEK